MYMWVIHNVYLLSEKLWLNGGIKISYIKIELDDNR